jgi:folate-binding protein YgfZ
LSSAFVDLTTRLKLRISGTDRERFLNGQLSNDIRRASAERVIEACILNAKGKLNGHVFVALEGKTYLLDAEPELRESLPSRLDRYIVADDVQLADESDRWSMFHLWGKTALPPAEELRLRPAIRFVEPGHDIWCDPAQGQDLFQWLSAQSTFYDAARFEVFRIEAGIPRWGRELTEEIIPIEANLEERTIDYNKGCYIGQEVISRIKMSGQTNKRLCGLVSLEDCPLSPGMNLFPPGERSLKIGWITSAAWSGLLNKQIALGFVKRGFNQPATRLHAIAR